MISVGGKKILIFGGTAGLGLHIAESFVKAGAAVVIGGRRASGTEIAESIQAKFVCVDVTREQSVKDACAQAVELLGGKLNVVINNVGAWPANLLDDVPEDEAKRIVDVNFLGTLWGIKHGAKNMVDGGSIINTTALIVYRCHPRMGVYSAMKAAVVNLIKTAANELGGRGITVNGICPTSVVGTEGNTDMDDNEVRLISALTPLGRLGEMSDYVGPYHLLASDAGKFINAQDIIVDGGLTAGLTDRAIEKLTA